MQAWQRNIAFGLLICGTLSLDAKSAARGNTCGEVSASVALRRHVYSTNGAENVSMLFKAFFPIFSGKSLLPGGEI